MTKQIANFEKLQYMRLIVIMKSIRIIFFCRELFQTYFCKNKKSFSNLREYIMTCECFGSFICFHEAWVKLVKDDIVMHGLIDYRDEQSLTDDKWLEKSETRGSTGKSWHLIFCSRVSVLQMIRLK